MDCEPDVADIPSTAHRTWNGRRGLKERCELGLFSCAKRLTKGNDDITGGLGRK
jgi:hypothetical protein